MINSLIPYEIHLTVSELLATKMDFFIDLCQKQTAKAIIIELAQGSHVYQPMFSKVIYEHNLEEIIAKSQEYITILQEESFFVQRLKIEIPSKYALISQNIPQNIHNNFQPYFEWHGKVNYERKEELLEICKENKVHLSKNSLKNELNNRFVTLREFENQQIFEQRVQKLLNNLQEKNFIIQKQEAEYCIYDNNIFLDNGWLDKK